MYLDEIDVQWTVISRSGTSAALTALETCASAAGWRFERGQVTTLDGKSLSVPGPMPSETLGAARYVKPSQSTQFSLFWSTVSQGGITQFIGGLYIEQHAERDMNFSHACERAFADMRTLFCGEDVLCVVLALEDDDGINVGPGIVGCYRPTLWGTAASSSSLPGLLIEHTSEWVVVRPMDDPTRGEVGACSVFAMPEPTRSSIQEVQAVLSDLI